MDYASKNSFLFMGLAATIFLGNFFFSCGKAKSLKEIALKSKSQETEPIIQDEPQTDSSDQKENVEITASVPKSDAEHPIQVQDPVIYPPGSRKPCILPSDVQAPLTISSLRDIVRTINALPKPVSISCLLDVLPRPLLVSGSSSTISAQPSQGDLNPRIFIRINNVVLSIVPIGKPSFVLELSEVLNHLESIKGEIPFPVEGILPEDAALDHIRRRDEIEGTVCAGCHGLEQPAPQYPGKGFISRPLKQRSDSFVNLRKIVEFYKQCREEISPRCEIFQSLFRKGEKSVKELRFPDEMTTIF